MSCSRGMDVGSVMVIFGIRGDEEWSCDAWREG